MSWLFASGSQSIGDSASTSVLPMNIQDWLPLGLTCLISLQSKGLSSVFSSTTVQKHQSFGAQASLWSTPYMNSGKIIALTIWIFVDTVMSLLFNILSRFAIAFFPRSKSLLISWLKSTVYSAFGAQENKICQCFDFFPIYLPWSDGTGCHDLSFLKVVLSQLFHYLMQGGKWLRWKYRMFGKAEDMSLVIVFARLSLSALRMMHFDCKLVW